MQKVKEVETKPKKVKAKKNSAVRVLGIDPGYGRMGFGLIEETGGNFKTLDYGCFETPKNESAGSRLLEIKIFLDNYIEKNKPEVVGVETLFFSKNVKTALQVGEARGVILLSVAEKNISLFEVSPQQVKMAVTGYGAAKKEQMQKMVKTILGLKEIPKPDDAADGLAVAIAAAQIRKFFIKL